MKVINSYPKLHVFDIDDTLVNYKYSICDINCWVNPDKTE
jgi:hydroxymethylpyrimidine pyrophosphatase-like HAD family hydrolase